ncbi:LOW QUALITY PROTEIN: leucine-rich repeat-containing protein 9 [Theristicus caerulescens]
MDIKRIIVAFHFQYTCNGLSYENIDQEVKTTALEMFFSAYPRIVGMKYCPNITTLILIGQGIQKISDLEYCLLLRELWIAECCLVKIDGLQKCVNLQKLYLYCNEISRIENLEALTTLNVLRLNNNLIKNIEGLRTLQNLQEVNLTGNLIEKIGRIINSQVSRTLNVLQEIHLQFQFCQDRNYWNLLSQALNLHHNEVTLRDRSCLGETMKSFNLVVQFFLMELETVGNINLEEVLSNKPSVSQKKKPFPLCNRLSICECPRTVFLKQAKAEGKTSSDPEKSFKHGKAIIAKVFLGCSAPACAMNPIYQVNYPEANSVFRPWKCLESDASTSGNMWASLEQRNCDCSHWHCAWFVFDHELVSEYIAEFEYITLLKKQCLFSTCSIIVEEGKKSTERFILSHDLQCDEEVLNMEPTVKVRPQIASLNKKTIFSVTKANISQVQVLNLNGNSLSNLQGTSRLKTLQKLIISFNEFTSLNDIYHLPSHLMEYFDASYNPGITLEGIRGLSKLQFFIELSWNQLKKSREDINILHKHTPNFLSLDITHNPWHKPASLQLSVIGQLNALTNLDGVLISNEEAAKALQYIAGLKMTQVSLLEYSRTDEEKTPILNVFPCAKILSQTCKNKVDSQMHCNNWYAVITVINLDDQLFKISNFEKLEHLRWAPFSNNNLTQIEGVESCLNLELTLDENYISTLDEISKLTKLTRHSVNNNHLISLKRHVFENLSYPHYIAIGNKRITSLVGLKKAYSLIELYVSNNFVYINQEVHHLKGLANLIILDMSRNVVWKQDHYQLFVLFHLPSLKALDGIAVEPTEESAKGLFGGKLTSDMIADRLGHSAFTEMQELNWTASTIRAVELVLADQFRNVCGMNLQNNNLMSFSGLIFLPNAKVLCLNYNHIESIPLGQKCPNQVTNRHQLYCKVASHGYGGCRIGENLHLIMQDLEDFPLGYNGITNMAQLHLSTKNLKLLFLQRNYISQIGLEGLQFLQELLLDHNRIKIISQGFLADSESSELEKLQVIPSLKVLSKHGNPQETSLEICLMNRILSFQLKRLQYAF